MISEKNVSTCLVSVAALVAGSNSVAAQDWSGFYVGISANSNSGTSPAQPYVYDEGYQMGSDTTGGAFAGYRWNASDSVVMGFEIAMQGPITVDADSNNSVDDYTFENLVDAKLSVGTSVGKALIYGFAGMSSGTLDAYGTDEYLYNATGMNYGIGVDYMVSDKFTVGVEYISRNMTGYTSSGNPENQKNADTVSLRASFKF
ncbi:Outer membrane protein beta-barrel domain containing protein [Paracoccaceae bacterium]